MKELINVIGLGYIGLPTALMLASKGLSVVGTDLNVEKVRQLQNGALTFEEEGLKCLYNKALENGIKFSNVYETAEMYIVAVPTPFNKFSKKVVADYLINAVGNIAKVCKNGSIVVVESTISPGTIERFIRPIAENLFEVNDETL